MGSNTPVVYLAIALRNAGNGIAVLQGWRFFPEAHRDTGHAAGGVPAADPGPVHTGGRRRFLAGAFRDTAAPGYEQARAAIEARQPWSVELPYADHEGGQRAISRFLALPVDHQMADLPPGGHQGQAGEAKPGWLASASRHWSLDREDGSEQDQAGRPWPWLSPTWVALTSRMGR